MEVAKPIKTENIIKASIFFLERMSAKSGVVSALTICSDTVSGWGVNSVPKLITTPVAGG